MIANLERTGDASALHRPSLILTRPPATEVDAGTEILVKVRVSCPSGCDLRGRVVDIVAHDQEVVAACALGDFAEGSNETGDCAFHAPDEVGEHSWTLVLLRHETEGIVH